MKLLTLPSRLRPRGVLPSRREPARAGLPGKAGDVGERGVREVPWKVTTRTDSSVEVLHRGDGPLHSVRFALAGPGVMGLSLPRTVHPGERLRVGVRAAPDQARTMLVLRWFEPDGTELLWPIAL